ncbi:hypothetical protein PG993_002087 [Apiospora rasikravindrae]|uniref:Uncharacterized protein n=1 Tax=Apiospora rasikravindrae TaxID=990691 RepID=A0ABR1UD81_9PEZI
MAKVIQPSSPSPLHPSCDTRRRQEMVSSSGSRKRLQPRPKAAAAQRPWQPCRKCGKSYVQLPLELCNECDKKLYCTIPPQKIRLDDKRPLLEAEPLVFPPSSSPPQKLNGGSTKLEKRGRRETKTLPSIESVVGAPVVARQSSVKSAGTSDGQHSPNSAARESKTMAGEGSVGEAAMSQMLSSPRTSMSIRRKPVATPMKENGGPVYELPAEVALAPVEQESRGRSTQSRGDRPLVVLQQAQQQQKRLPVPTPPAVASATATGASPPPTPPKPRTYLLAQPTRDPQASFAQRVVRDAGGPLSAERQRVLAQELSRAQAELECSRRAVRNLNEEMARMGLRKFRAEELRRLREENRRVQEQISTRASSMAQAGVEVTEEGRRRRRWEMDHQHQHLHQQQDLDLKVFLEKGAMNPESLSRVYGQLCGRCRGAVQEFIES